MTNTDLDLSIREVVIEAYDMLADHEENEAKAQAYRARADAMRAES